jgi:hypothetical protein
MVKLRAGVPVPTNRMLFGVNRPWPMSTQPLDDSDLIMVLKALHPGTLRFPGGTVSSFWDIGAGRFVPDKDIKGFGFQRWAGQYGSASKQLGENGKNLFSVSSFDRLCKTVGARPIWVMNLATLSGEHEAEAIKSMNAAGVDLGFVELGNEYDMGLFRRALPTAADYIRKAGPVVDAVRKVSERARIAVSASTAGMGDVAKAEKARAKSDTRKLEWTDGLYKSRNLYDAWVVHDYGLGLNAIRAISEVDRPSSVLALPEKLLGGKAEMVRRSYGGLPVWLTEYNAAFQGLKVSDKALDDSATAFFAGMKNSSLHALAVAGYLLSLVQNQDVYKVACYHSLAGMDGFGVAKFAKAGKRLGCQVNAAAQVFAHIAAVAADSTQMSSARIEGGPGLRESNDEIRALQAAVFSSAGRTVYVVLNRARRAVAVELEAPSGSRDALVTVYSADPSPKPLEWIDLPADAESKFPWPGPIKAHVESIDAGDGSAKCAIAPLSLAIVSISQSKEAGK